MGRQIGFGAIVLAGVAAALVTLSAQGTTSGTQAARVYQEEIHIGIGAGEDRGFASSSIIPAGKRVIVEYISAFARVAPGQRVWELLVAPTAGGSLVNTDLLMTLQGTYRNGAYDGLVSSGPVKLYADPSTTIDISAFLTTVNGAAPADVWVKLSGKLVPCGNGQGCPLTD